MFYRALYVAILSTTVAMSPLASASEPLSDSELLAMCTGDEANTDKCATYISGVRAGMAAQRRFIGYVLATQGAETATPEDQTKLLLWLTTREPFCSDSEVTDEHVTDAFIKLMEREQRKNPEDVGKVGAGASVLLAGQWQYPCN